MPRVGLPTAAPTRRRPQAVLVPSEELPDDAVHIRGWDFDAGASLDGVMGAMLATGLQATALGQAVQEVNRMVSGGRARASAVWELGGHWRVQWLRGRWEARGKGTRRAGGRGAESFQGSARCCSGPAGRRERRLGKVHLRRAVYVLI